MSIVRYTNKKTGTVSLYESTSYYDPVTKQSRPKRKYLGTEDPVTGELIPSSGKRGRKKRSEGQQPQKKEERDAGYKAKYEELLRQSTEKDARIKELEHENKRLLYSLCGLRDTITEIISGSEK